MIRGTTEIGVCLCLGGILINYVRFALALNPTTHRETDYASEA